MSANAVQRTPAGIPEYHLNTLDLAIPTNKYCDECKNMLKTWPWASIQHQAVNAMKQLGCPLCSFIYDTLNLHRRIYSWEHNKLCTLDAWADEGDPHCDATTIRSPITHLTTDSVFKAIRKWMEDCSKSHPDCRSLFGDFLADPAELPKRVVDVNAKDGFLRIHESLPYQKETYTALSYVWDVNAKSGEESQKREVWPRREEDGQTWVEARSLPLGFQDAVELTRRINVRYLWIDALCVHQDDPEDRKENVSKVLDIFRNAALCIRPANIDNIHESFLRKEGPYLGSPVCKVRVSNSKGRDILLKLTTKMNDATSGMDRYDERLRKRSWSVMEAFASPRHVTITSHNEIAFFCLNPHYTTRFPYYQWVYTINDSYNQYHYIGATGASWAEYFKTHKNKHRPWEPWTHLITDIHQGAVTRPEDRLEMLSSIAKHHIWDEEYLFGLWKKHAREGLMWEPYGAEERGQVLDHAPSWSWGSVGVRVGYPDLIFLRNWQFRFVSWARGSAGKPPRSDPPVLATAILKGKIVPQETFKKRGLDLLAERDYYSHGWTGTPLKNRIPENMWDDIYFLLLAQTDFGPPGNRHAGPTKENNPMGSTGSAQKGIHSSQSGTFAETGPSETQPGSTELEPEHEQAPVAVRSKRRSIVDWFGSVPKSFSSQRPHISSMRQRWPGSSSRHGRSQSQSQPEASTGAQKQYAEKLSHTKRPSEPAVVVEPDSSEDQGTQELTWRRSLEEKGAPYPPEFMASPPPEVKSGFDIDKDEPATPDPKPSTSGSKPSQEDGKRTTGEVRRTKSEGKSAGTDDEWSFQSEEKDDDSMADPDAIGGRLKPHKGTKLMVLRRVSGNTYERFTMTTRHFNEEMVSVLHKVELEVIYLI